MIDKEKMKTGWYYSQEKHGAEICHWDSDHEKWDSIFGSDEVLAPVPSYQEYLALESDSLAKKEAEEIIAELEAENEKLKEEVSRECYKVSEAYCYIEELKDLLKECVPYVNHRYIETRELLTKPYTASDKILHKKAEKLLTKIDEVLK